MKQFLVSLCLALGTFAGASSVATAAPPQPADVTIKTATEEVRKLIGENHEKYVANMDSFYSMVDSKIVPYFDTKGIAQLVLGANWKTATPDQRTRFEAAFKNALIRTYARALLDYYDSVNIDWSPLKGATATDAAVKAKINRANNAPPIPLVFLTHVVADQWKIYDISVEGISIGQSFKGQVNSEVQANGLDKTIQKFETNQVKPAPSTPGAGG